MAAPTITNVQVTYPPGKTSVGPGEVATITVTATDPDAGTRTLTVTVADEAGNTSAPTQVNIPVSDALTYSATKAAGVAGTIGGGGSSNVITYTA